MTFETIFDPVSFGVYTLDGELAYDLGAYIDQLTVDSVSSPGPARKVVTLPDLIILPYLMVGGLYELRITSQGGSYHSETIRVNCDACFLVDGVFGVDELVFNARYLYTDGRVATYCGLDCENPTDANGFRLLAECGKVAVVGSGPSLGEWLWNGEEWVRVPEMRCFHRVEWKSCGDVGTVLYEDKAFRNILYLKEEESPLGEPVPVFSEGRETGLNAEEVKTFARKDVDYSVHMRMPWYLLDAITETPLLSDVTFRKAHEEAADPIDNIRFDIQWDNACQASVVMTFRAGDSSYSSGCCNKYDRTECVPPNAEVMVVLLEGNYYVAVGIDEEGMVPTGFAWSINGEAQDPVTYEGPATYLLGPVPPNSTVVVNFLNEECPWVESANVPGPEGCSGPMVFYAEGAEGNPNVSGENSLKILTSTTFFAPSEAAFWTSTTPGGFTSTQGGTTVDWAEVFPDQTGRWCYAPATGLALIQPNTDFTRVEFAGEIFTMIDLSGCSGMAIARLLVTDTPNLASFTRPTFTAAMLYLDLRGVIMGQAAVNAMLVELESFGTSGGTIRLDGAGVAAPTGSGLTAITAMLGRSWSITVNP